MKNFKYLGWFSCGATSTIACKLAIDKYGADNVDLWYIDTGAHHIDNERFIAECEKWLSKKVLRAKSTKFNNPLEVAKKELFNTPYGAPCTKYLKKEVRQKQIMPLYECVEVKHILGFEYTKHEINRALRWKEQVSKDCIFPLIEERLTKQDCLKMLKKAGIEMPIMYRLGYNNNNCIGCFKGGAGYWNKIRKDFPDVFKACAEVERETGHTILKDKGKQLYLDDLPETKGNQKDLQIEDCGLFCDIEMAGLPIKELEQARCELLNN